MNSKFPQPCATTRLFCFPWAGGVPSFFTAWGRDVSENVEVIGVCLPGRENRYKEPLCRDSKEIINWIVKTMHDEYFDKPFAFYGHSMGATLACMVALELKRLYNKEPEHMFLSGGFAPHSVERNKLPTAANLSKGEFVDIITSYGGIPTEEQQDNELIDSILPQLQADSIMVQSIQYELQPGEKPPLSCPIDFFDGEEETTDHDVTAWRQITSGSFTYRTLPGGHFFIREPDNIKKMIQLINFRFADIV